MGRSRRPPGPAGGAVAVAVLAAGALTGCGDLQFRQDHRVSFTAPADRSTVTTPVTLRWSVRDFALTGLDGSRDRGQGAFGVFIDRAPVRPGEDLRSVASGDESCLRSPGCPDAAYLAARGVYTTTQPRLTVDRLVRTAPSGRPDLHRATVVLLDGTGSRIGESAWQRDFRVADPVAGAPG